MKNLCIIPARGGSKRIPGKNGKNFNGKPIISYSIKTAIDTGLFDEIMVSTDDEDIASIALSCGASVPFLRNTKLSDDFTPLKEVYVEVLNKYLKAGVVFENFCSILPTAPMLSSEEIKQSYFLLNEVNKAVVSIVEYEFPIQRYLIKTANSIRIGDLEDYRKRSQDLQPAFHDAGQFYWANVAAYLSNQSFFALTPLGYELDRKRYFDIDTIKDWERLEMLHKIIGE